MENHRITPPKLLEQILKMFVKEELQEEILGDLHEYYMKIADKPTWKRTILYWFHLLHFFRPFAIKKLDSKVSGQKLNYYGMFKNNLKTGLRNILRYKGFSIINVFGLAVAMSVGMLIMLMLNDQMAMDQFHQAKDRIYQVNTKIPSSGRINASSPSPLAHHLVENYPAVEDAIRLTKRVGGDLISRNNKSAIEVRGFFTDDDFFNVFDFEVVQKMNTKLLDQPRQLVISSEVAKKLFEDENPIGKTLEFQDRKLEHISIQLGPETGSEAVDWGAFTVTGVIDTEQFSSHLIFDVLVSAATLPSLEQMDHIGPWLDDWGNHSIAYTYVKLKDQASSSQLDLALAEVTKEKYVENQFDKELLAKPLSEVRLGDFAGNPTSLQLPKQAYQVLAFLALIVMISAVINYTSLSTARALTRAKEIGVRKVNGASRYQLIGQFLTEAILISFFALIIAFLLLWLIRPAFLGLWSMNQLHFKLEMDLSFLLICFVFALATGLFAGIYPSFVLSQFSPLRALKKPEVTGKKKLGMRKALNVTQFSLSLIFIITTLLINRQFQHYVNFDHGMSTDQVLNIAMQGNDYELLKKELGEVSGVEMISAGQMLLATPNSLGQGIKNHAGDEKWVTTEFYSVDRNFTDLLKIGLSAGDKLNGADQVVINEFGVKALGYTIPSEAVGKTLYSIQFEKEFVIAGVLRDFKFQTPVMGEGNKGLVLFEDPEKFRFLHMKVAGTDPENVLERLHDAWDKVDPIHAFQYEWYNDTLVASNQWMGDLATIVGFIGFLAIVISCLGLLGMAIYTTERRVKEVSIRKVLGANVSQLLIMLGKSFMVILMISILIASPLGYLLNQLWLESIPNRVEFSIWMVIGSGAILMFIGLLTIGSQIIRISQTNPVESLKDE